MDLPDTFACESCKEMLGSGIHNLLELLPFLVALFLTISPFLNFT